MNITLVIVLYIFASTSIAAVIQTVVKTRRDAKISTQNSIQAKQSSIEKTLLKNSLANIELIKHNGEKNKSAPDKIQSQIENEKNRYTKELTDSKFLYNRLIRHI